MSEMTEAPAAPTDGGITEAAQTLARQRMGVESEPVDTGRTDDGYSSNSDGLKAAAADIARDRETRRPEPPSASDLVAGVGNLQKITLEGDGPISIRTAAKSVGALHDAQEQGRALLEQELAQHGVEWESVLDGTVSLDENGKLVNPPARASEAPLTEAQAKQGETEAQEWLKAQTEQQERQRVALELHQRQANYDQMNDAVRHGKFLLNNAATDILGRYPEIRSQGDLQRLWMQNPAREIGRAHV